MYDKIPEPSDDENDMLDLAFGLTETCVRAFPVAIRGRTNVFPTVARVWDAR